MKTRRTLPLVNAAFIALIAIVALTSAVSFIRLSELVRHSVRTTGLARELEAEYRRLEFRRFDGEVDPAELATRRAALGARSDELARRVAATSRYSTQAMVSVAVTSFGTIIAGAALMVLVSRRIGRPLELMLRATRRIANGHLGHRVDYAAPDEMGLLAQSFDRMAHCLQRSLYELKSQKATLERRVAEATAELRTLSLTDELTELPNLRHLRDAFDETARYADETGTPLTLAVLGIDDFRTLNDRFGYEAGNLVLVAFARIVRGAARDVDFVARGNGVQFIVLMPGLDHLSERFVRQVEGGLASLQKLVRHRTGRDVGITVCFGHSLFPTDGCSLHALLHTADHRMAARRIRAEAPSAGATPAREAAPQGKEPS